MPGPHRQGRPPPGSRAAVHRPRLTVPQAAAIPFSPVRSGFPPDPEERRQGGESGPHRPAPPRRGSLGPQPWIVSRGRGRPPPSDEVSERQIARHRPAPLMGPPRERPRRRRPLPLTSRPERPGRCPRGRLYNSPRVAIGQGACARGQSRAAGVIALPPLPALIGRRPSPLQWRRAAQRGPRRWSAAA